MSQNVDDEIEATLREKYPDAVIDIIEVHAAPLFWWADVVDDDEEIQYLVSEYGDEYLDFYRFAFSKKTALQEDREREENV